MSDYWLYFANLFILQRRKRNKEVQKRRSNNEDHRSWSSSQASSFSSVFLGSHLSIMACLNSLKSDIKRLESVFNKDHERFQIVSATLDELTCTFIGRNGKKYEIHANFTVSKTSLSLLYPFSFFFLASSLFIMFSSLLLHRLLKCPSWSFKRLVVSK